ncbi:class I tRNA ligase family protein [Pseudomonas tremae]|uniref:class I tRNA ligase family protein n=1 Tax=Pseudomonas tremae TaxID=200454 RepID=UPI001F45626B|nr:class I tRNA ligase family protein [Pseudomonas tremae]MCF5714920.1 class I tRNA ligase family protein [Pseudomonas tremae]UQB31809.1 class I tRNA ligase family protein [Pseudomonas tremae]
MAAVKRYVITLPPPTPNGGLHLGHLSGPFLAGDILARAARLRGDESFVTCYSDVNQSYVRVTAGRQGVDPHALAAQWTEQIGLTLAKCNIAVNDYYAPNEEANNFVRELFLGLYEQKILVRKPFPFFRERTTGQLLDEAGVSGYCPFCLAACKCGICEACGNLTSALNLLDPRNTLSGSCDLEVTWIDVMVIELERYRREIIAFYDQNKNFRQRYLWLVEDAMKGTLPDFPISVPSSWGIPVGLDEFEGQMFNPWPEIMAQLVHSYRRAERLQSTKLQTQYINFFGFDNSYFYAVLHVALLTQIDNGKWLPAATIINEFYNLDHAKFSTSNGHVIWADDSIERYSSDELRFYSAMNCPGFEKSNYNEHAMVAALDKSLHKVWRKVAEKFNIALSKVTERQSLTSCSSATLHISASSELTILKSMSIERFHVRQAAEDSLHLLSWIDHALDQPETAFADVVLLLKTFARCCHPLMPRGSDVLHKALFGVKVDHDPSVEDIQPQPLDVNLFRLVVKCEVSNG